MQTSSVRRWRASVQRLRSYNLPAVTVRLFAIYGPGQPPKTLVPSAVCAALEGRDFLMTPGEQIRDFFRRRLPWPRRETH
jgi:nucleoside-diphosphate-sugar epimerase